MCIIVSFIHHSHHAFMIGLFHHCSDINSSTHCPSIYFFVLFTCLLIRSTTAAKRSECYLCTLHHILVYYYLHYLIVNSLSIVPILFDFVVLNIWLASLQFCCCIIHISNDHTINNTLVIIGMIINNISSTIKYHVSPTIISQKHN
jgi:presenilin-like A22 family membrane protease